MNATWNRSAPIDCQLRDRAVSMILDGSLRPGDALPHVASAAADLRVNPAIVARAYGQLVTQELVEDRPGLGLVVSPGAPDRLRRTERERFVREKWPRMLECMKQLGFDTEPLYQAIGAH